MNEPQTYAMNSAQTSAMYATVWDRTAGLVPLPVPRCGYGGSCFPKDVKALAASALVGAPLEVVEAVERANAHQRTVLRRAAQVLRRPQRKAVALWGLAFKANTDDLREAPSLYTIAELTQRRHGRGA